MKIAQIVPLLLGHVELVFEDGSHTIVGRGDHEAHAPKPGDEWPPKPAEPAPAPAPEPVAVAPPPPEEPLELGEAK